MTANALEYAEKKNPPDPPDEASLSLIPKLNKSQTKTKLQTKTTHEYQCTGPKECTNTQIQRRKKTTPL